MNAIKWMSNEYWDKAHAVLIQDSGEIYKISLCRIKPWPAWEPADDKPQCKNCLREVKYLTEKGFL